MRGGNTAGRGRRKQPRQGADRQATLHVLHSNYSPTLQSAITRPAPASAPAATGSGGGNVMLRETTDKREATLQPYYSRIR